MNSRDRLIGTVKNAVAVNLRYTSLLLGLGKDYLKSFEAAVRDGIAGENGAAEKSAAPRRAPILLAGRLDEAVSGAFTLNNPSDRELNVTLVAQGEIDAKLLTIEPREPMLAPGTAATIRLKVVIVDAFEEGRDYAGTVTAPGLSTQGVDFVVRRLADPATRKADKPA